MPKNVAFMVQSGIDYEGSSVEALCFDVSAAIARAARLFKGTIITQGECHGNIVWSARFDWDNEGNGSGSYPGVDWVKVTAVAIE
jgi:hypothetical protein